MLIAQSFPSERLWRISSEWTYPQLYLAIQCLEYQAETQREQMDDIKQGRDGRDKTPVAINVRAASYPNLKSNKT